MSDSVTQRLGQEPVGRLLLRYALPAVVGTIVNSLYNIIDRIYIGQGIGPLAISGLALTFPILTFLQAFGMLVGAGAAARVSIFLGRKETASANRTLANALLLTLFFSIATIVPALIYMKDLLRLFGAGPGTLPYAESYLAITIPGNLLATLSFSYNAVMRASGYPARAMLAMLAGAVLNILLDPLFIFVFGLGIRGAAIATVISMAVSAGWVMGHFLKKSSVVRFERSAFRIDWRIILGILSIGMSPFAMQLAAGLVSTLMNTTLIRYGGDLAVGAYGIINSFGILLVMLVLGVSQGMQPIVGYNYGAGRNDRVLATLRRAIGIGTLITSSGFVCSFLIPETIVRAFTPDPELIRIAANGLHITFLSFVVAGFQMVTSMFFQSIGIAWKSMLQGLLRQCLFLIPGLLVFPRYFGLDGVWMASPVADALAAVVSAAFLVWQVRRLKRNPVIH